MSRYERSLVWLRRDYRLSDHRALYEACAQSAEVIPVFVIDEVLLKGFKNLRQVQFIQECLDDLDSRLREKGSRLLVVRGNPAHAIPELASRLKAKAVFLNHDYEPMAKLRDAHVERELKKLGVAFHSFKDQVIFERREILSGGGSPYKVFTPYSRAWLKALESNRAEHLKDYRPDLKKLVSQDALRDQNARFSELGFPEVAGGSGSRGGRNTGEEEARALLKRFSKVIANYKTDRDFPAIEGTSRLSVHFRFGTISPRQAVRFCAEHMSEGAKTWLNELIWREFYMMILDQFPHVEKGAFKPEYDSLKWEWNREHFKAWCEGRTGYPIVDAGMRQLNETGFMHNRLRMIVAMFLTKDLLIHWQEGERYFAEKLLDHELSANNGGWQWSASTGCDAQPYFRVMNPVSQSERFDPKGEFIKHWVPELKDLDSKRIHWPHEEGGLFSSGSKGYADPLVDHKEQRLKAIRMFKKD
jgi:deoxyribodipyrimidine photo-lyase